MMSFLQASLDQVDQQDQRRELKQVDSPQGREIIIKGKKVLNFSSNDYLGLASDERLRQAAIESIKVNGVGAGAARLICGNMPEHALLEKRIAAIKGVESCLLFSTGYMANIGVIPALMGREDIIFADKLNHACLVDGARLSRATVKRYRHNDMDHLESFLKQSTAYPRRLIVTDSVFSMDGDRAPLKEIVALAKRYDAMVMVDEAHAFGVLGARGAGLVEELGLTQEVAIQMGTLSKAAGCFGAYVAGSKVLTDFLMHHARSFVYTTALPPSVAAAAVTALEIIEEGGSQRRELLARAGRLRQTLERAGFEPSDPTTQIVPVLVGESGKALALAQALFDDGIFVQAIRPPTVPQGQARLRVALTTEHTDVDVERLTQSLIKNGKKLCLI